MSVAYIHFVGHMVSISFQNDENKPKLIANSVSALQPLLVQALSKIVTHYIKITWKLELTEGTEICIPFKKTFQFKEKGCI